MSGIVGFVRIDGRPLDRRLLQRMTAAIAYRGPDKQLMWVGDSVGFGHTLLTANPDSPMHDELVTFDGSVWITADARIDARSELVTELEMHGRRVGAAATAAQLILHAYYVWGERCVEDLLGDFAFAIWDGTAGRLFCARDRFGIKPFFYAASRRGIVFSNTLDCLRLHPDVGDSLDELPVTDLLLFDYRLDNSTTSFADIKRLPAAHSLTYENGRIRTAGYTALPTHRTIRYRRAQDYVDHFHDVLKKAVADRSRASRVALWMSGGLDSTAIAAVLRNLADDQAPLDLRAYTAVWDRVIPDGEGEFAVMAARSLGIELEVISANDDLPFEEWDTDTARAPEPAADPFKAGRHRQWRHAAAHARVALDGTGADELLFREYLLDLPGTMPPHQLLADLLITLAVHHRRPAVGLRVKLTRRFGRVPSAPTLPAWLNRSLQSRTDVAAHWARWHAPEPPGGGSSRASAQLALTTIQSRVSFDWLDPGVTGVPIDTTLPFLDVRVVEYPTAIPALPWCVAKQLLRVALRGALPETVRLRPKTPLPGDPLSAHLQRGTWKWPDRVEPHPHLATFVDLAALRDRSLKEAADPWPYARVLSLNHWLASLAHSRAVLQARASASFDRVVEIQPTGSERLTAGEAATA